MPEVSHISHAVITHGNPNQLNSEDDKYQTTFWFVLPLVRDEIKLGWYGILDENDREIVIEIKEIISIDLDPIISHANSIGLTQIKSIVNENILSIPFSNITDNQGRYPCYFAQVIFPYKVAEWQKPSTPADLQRKIADMRIIGATIDQDKLMVLRVINDLLQDDLYNSSIKPKLISYNSVTILSCWYLEKATKNNIVNRFLYFSAPNAHIDIINKYFTDPKDQKFFDETIAGLFLRVRNNPIKNHNDLSSLILAIIKDFLQHPIETRRLSTPFWLIHKDKKICEPHSEENIQETIFALLEKVFKIFGISLHKETDEGIGNLDFCASFTTVEGQALKIAIEFKRAHHSKISHGIKKQLPQYMDAIQTREGIFLVMWFKDTKSKYFSKPDGSISELEIKLKEYAKRTGEKNIQVLLINASINDKSASK